MIRAVKNGDAGAIAEIYNHYIANTSVSFEEEVLSPQEMEQRIRDVTGKFPWLVFIERDQVRGYAYATPWRTRTAYRFTVELSVYLDKNARGRGMGSCLYEALLKDLKNLGVQRVIGGMALPNLESQRLHEKFGFRQVAHFEKVGFKFGQWIDVGYWELMFGSSGADESSPPPSHQTPNRL